ncbi:NUAK family SNF1-like kinase 1 [Osmerus eperlanus]|uniref:NUAK family SNF1-like kinase 1 n=1 Tax=Osmerus eperlanus TaxID=29151 RepID=UPI002E134AAB
MGRREAQGDSRSVMNTDERSGLESLQDIAASGNDTGDELPSYESRCFRGRDKRRRHADENVLGPIQNQSQTQTSPVAVKTHQHKHNLKHRFEVMETLGKGTYGKVKRAMERASLKMVAIKSIRKERITDDLDKVHIQREIEITSSLKHPNIIRIHEVFESRDKIVIVMEYASRGELYDYVHERRRLPETEARDVFRQITSAVHYCHKNGVVHRDLKLENILLDQEMNVKLADFGLSNNFQKNSLLQTYCGSPLYASPEIVRGLPYVGPEVDCWALGVLLYTLVYGSMPFDGASYSTLTEQIRQGRYRRPNPPSDACALIDWLLKVRVDERATVEDVASHWWVNWGYEESVCNCPMTPHQDCPSPLLARYIDLQNQMAATNNLPIDPICPSSDPSLPHLSHPSPHPFYFSYPLKGDRGGGGKVRGGASSVRKSRKENTIPQNETGACSSVCTTTPTAAAASPCSASTGSGERKKPKGILKPQRSFDSVFLPHHIGRAESSSTQACNAPPPFHRAHSHTHQEVLSTSMPTPSTFSQPSSKMPKKGILKNLYGVESGYSSSPERRGSGAGEGVGRRGGGGPEALTDSSDLHLRTPSSDGSLTMRTEALRRRKGILKRNGKFSRSLDLPDDHRSSSSSSSSAPLRFPQSLQQLLQDTGGNGSPQERLSRPPSVVSEDSILSSDSFDLLDLSAQSRRRLFCRSVRRSTCSSEEDLDTLCSEVGRGEGQGEDG